MSKRVMWRNVNLYKEFYFDPYNPFLKFDHLLPGHLVYNVEHSVPVVWSLWDLSYSIAFRVMGEELLVHLYLLIY